MRANHANGEGHKGPPRVSVSGVRGAKPPDQYRISRLARYVAFLRAINVGGRVVTMETLRRSFVRLGLTDVETFIASGNVVFSSPARNTAKLEREIESRLQKDLGYEVATFVRRTEDVIAIARYQAFPPNAVETAVSLNVGFLAAPLSAEARKSLDGLATPADVFHVNDREWYWLSQTRQSDSK